MIISIMNASGSALPSEQFAKKARPGLIRPHASPLKMRLNYEPAALSLRPDWNPPTTCHGAGASASAAGH
jgi:hypothetical protein